MIASSELIAMTDEMTQQPSAGVERDNADVAPARRTVSAARAKSADKRNSGWSKTIVNFVLDSVLLLLVCGLLFTAAVLRFVFPVPTMSAGWTLWGFDYDAWANVQFILVTVFGLAILLHVMLHWSWVCGVMMTKVLKRDRSQAKLDEGQQTLWGVGLLIVVVNVVGLLVGLAYLTVQSPGI